MKRIVLLVALFALLSAGTFAQQLTVAVSTFEARGGLTKDDADAVTELFISELVSSKTVKVVDRNSFDKIIAEMKFQASDWTDGNKVAQLGKALSANSIIRGTVMSLAGQTAVTTSILDINTAEIISSSTLRMASMIEVFDKMPAFVKDLMKNLPDPPGVYKIGGKGPAGGIIFYDKGFLADGWRYLEAAPVDFPNAVQWGAYQQSVTGTSTAIGSGKKNTELIVNRLNQLGESGRAAQLCASLDFDGVKDWFLPSKDELYLMYKNLKAKGLGGFSNNGYWSSSKDDDYGALLQLFSNGAQYDSNKGFNYSYSVRAIRAF
ncbi:MAG: hypothetical protein FWB95_05125 [Treponema sp.]|nr:hypothetical protein [Treponema sp.]